MTSCERRIKATKILHTANIILATSDVEFAWNSEWKFNINIKNRLNNSGELFRIWVMSCWTHELFSFSFCVLISPDIHIHIHLRDVILRDNSDSWEVSGVANRSKMRNGWQLWLHCIHSSVRASDDETRKDFPALSSSRSHLHAKIERFLITFANKLESRELRSGFCR